MPYYNYVCSAGHVTEARRGYDDSRVPCGCGLSAQRAPFSESAYLIGETVPKGQATSGAAKDRHGRYRLDLFSEAQQEVAHDYAKVGREPPNLFQKGLAEARKKGAPIRA